MILKEEAYHRIEELIDRFGEQLDDYKRSDYNETLTRRDFIDPFFKALGWDIDNSQGFAEAYREVIHEDRVRVGKATKAPDYSFRLGGGKRLFFVEAKKPEVVIKYDTSVAYQIRRYGWSAKLAVSIITDFEEFAVYDCTVKPQSSDSASVARIKYLRFTDYLKEFEFLWDTFSKERVLKGSFDRYVLNDSVKKGTTTVDKAFLASLDTWRTYLATSISLRNKELDEDEINFVVQLTIDRLIFLRIAEDRGIEPYGQLRASANQKGDIWQNLFYNFRNADEKYNSGLFDLKKDVISAGLVVDNKVIKTIVNEMYYPDCPYEFSVFSVEILGSAYEQFLGKVIRIDKAHRAKIEEKPEVRKAGGVYYTPQYIVDYIVKSCLSPALSTGEGALSPKGIEKLKIVDPACGSGSFLIGAYQYLLDYHKKYYADNGVKTGKKESPVTPDGNLTSAEKKRILLNNIYGVDIDVNAVEVTKLSLLLKCLEGETETSIAQQQQLWHERILPTLDNNIKSGNSLIDIDFYSSQLDFGEEKKIKPFNWQKAFPEVFKQGGFDVAIGNPPWGAEIPKTTDAYIREKFVSANEKSFDSYAIFTEKALNILRDFGRMGFITPDTFLRKDDFYSFRKYLFENYSFYEIIETGPVFSQVRDTWCCIFFINKIRPNNETFISQKKISRFVVSVEERLYNFRKNVLDSSTQILQEVWARKGNLIVGYIATKEGQDLIEKIEKHPKLGSMQNYKLSRGEEGSKYNIVESKTGNFKMIIPADIKTNFVADGKSINSESLTIGKLANIYSHPKIWVTRIQKMRWKKRIVSGLDIRTNSAGMKTLQTITSLNDNVNELYYLQAILSSNLINFYCINYLSDDMNQAYLSRIPIRIINKNNLNDIKLADEIIRNIKLLMSLISQLFASKLQTKSSQIESKIDFYEERINQLVYQLYGLTEEEIRIVEG